MYKEDILDLYKNPENAGKLEEPDFVQKGENPSCGDDTEIHIKLDKEEEIESIKHETDGCAISTASISIATKEVKGLKRDEVLGLDKDWMLERLGVDVSPMRMKCALLGLKTIQEALEAQD